VNGEEVLQQLLGSGATRRRTLVRSPAPALTRLLKAKAAGQGFWKCTSAFFKRNRGTKPFLSPIWNTILRINLAMRYKLTGSGHLLPQLEVINFFCIYFQALFFFLSRMIIRSTTLPLALRTEFQCPSRLSQLILQITSLTTRQTPPPRAAAPRRGGAGAGHRESFRDGAAGLGTTNWQRHLSPAEVQGRNVV